MTAAPPIEAALAAAGARLVERDGRQQAADFGDPLAEVGLLRRAVGVGVRPRSFTRVSGRDAERFLQGLVSNDVPSLEVGSARHALVLTPKARVVADPRLLREAPDAFVLDVEAGGGAALRRVLARYRLAAQAAIDDLDASFAAIAVGGPSAGLVLLDAFGVLPRVAAPEGEGFAVPLGDDVVHGIASGFCGEKGFELIGPVALAASAFDRLVAAARARDGGPVGTTALEVLRIEAGVPRLGAEVSEEIMPAEAGLVDRAVSFTKGCYVGQEPVARLHYRGHANRTLRSILLADVVPPAGAEVVLDGRAVGRVTSAAASPTLGRVLALGIVRREVDDGTRVRVTWDGQEVEGEVAATPAFSNPRER